MTKKNMLLAASVAGLVAAAMTASAPAQAEDVKCYGVNKCKGTGDCGGKGSSCHGTNACKGHGWLSMPEDVCLKIEGGRLTAEE